MKAKEALDALASRNGTTSELDSFQLSAEGKSTWSGIQGRRLLKELGVNYLGGMKAENLFTTTNPTQRPSSSKKCSLREHLIHNGKLALLGLLAFLLITTVSSSWLPDKSAKTTDSSQTANPIIAKRIAFTQRAVGKTIDLLGRNFSKFYKVDGLDNDGWDSYNLYDAVLKQYKVFAIESTPYVSEDGRVVEFTLTWSRTELWAKLQFLLKKPTEVHCAGATAEAFATLMFAKVYNKPQCELLPLAISIAGKIRCYGFEKLTLAKRHAAEEFAMQLYRYYIKHFIKNALSVHLDSVVKNSKIDIK